MRLDYVPEDPQLDSHDDQAVVERIKARRGGKLISLDRALLRAPAIADGWNSFLGAVRTQTSLPASIRELAICRIAVLNGAWYEWDQHAPLLRATNALSSDAVAYIRSRPGNTTAPPDKGLIDAMHLAALEYTDAMTLGCVVPGPVFAAVEAAFSAQAVVEITATVAAYNCVSRFLVALDVGEMAEKYGVDLG